MSTLMKNASKKTFDKSSYIFIGIHGSPALAGSAAFLCRQVHSSHNIVNAQKQTGLEVCQGNINRKGREEEVWSQLSRGSAESGSDRCWRTNKKGHAGCVFTLYATSTCHGGQIMGLSSLLSPDPHLQVHSWTGSTGNHGATEAASPK